MTDPFRLRPEHRADFEATLHLALNTQDIRNAVRTDPTGRAVARLRILALRDADGLTAAASALPLPTDPIRSPRPGPRRRQDTHVRTE